jgi:hypothetical protein
MKTNTKPKTPPRLNTRLGRLQLKSVPRSSHSFIPKPLSLSIQICLVAIAAAFLPLAAASKLPEGQSVLNGSSFEASSDTTAAPVQWFVDRTPAEHQNDLNSLPANGWRLISLNIYGLVTSHLYATVWVQHPGPIQKTALAVDGPNFDVWMDFWASQGYVPVIITTMGDNLHGYLNAAVLEKISVLSWSKVSDRSQGEFNLAVEAARARQEKLVSIDQYGFVRDPRFCGVFHHNPNNDGWVHILNEASTSDAQTTLRRQASKPYWRPLDLKFFAEGGINQLKTSSIYTDTCVGSWDAKFFQTKAAITAEDATQSSLGRRIVRIQGGTFRRFHVIWAEQDSPKPREFHATGPPATGFK